jgi:hypothetical protein
MKFYSFTLRWPLLLHFIIPIVESNAMPLMMHRPALERPFSLALRTSHHALMSSRILALLPRNHESQSGEHDSKYDGEEDGNEETRDNSRGRQQEDRYGNEEQMEGTGTSRGHRNSSLEPGDRNERTSGARVHEGSDERVGPYSDGSPGDSEADPFPYGAPYAPTNKASRPEHNHPNTQDTFESDEVPKSSPKHPMGGQPHEPDLAPQRGQDPVPEETTPSDHVASSSLANKDVPYTVCSTLSQLYQRLDGPEWYNQEGWKDPTPHRIRTRDHKGSRETQRPFRTSEKTEDDTMGGQGEDRGDEDRSMTRDEDPVVVKGDSSDPSCCSWFGITCRGSRVVGLALARNGLNGPYPTDVIQSMVDLETV